MSSEPLVSVIIIFLNTEGFIQEAIDSVFAQTYNTWELLLVDDGSTDRSTEIALRYVEKYPDRVRYLEHDGHQNRGMSATRNLGIHNSKGEYITFLDADDVWLPNTLAEQVAILESHREAGMVYGPVEWWYSWTGNPEDVQRDFVKELGFQLNTLIKPPKLLNLFLGKQTIPPTGFLVRHQLVKDVGGFEESFRSICEDQVFAAKVCLQAAVYVSSSCWYKYRQHPESSCYSAKRTGTYYPARQTFLNWLEEYSSKQKIPNTEFLAVLHKELWPYRHPILSHLSKRAECFANKIRELWQTADP